MLRFDSVDQRPGAGVTGGAPRAAEGGLKLELEAPMVVLYAKDKMSPGAESGLMASTGWPRVMICNQTNLEDKY